MSAKGLWSGALWSSITTCMQSWTACVKISLRINTDCNAIRYSRSLSMEGVGGRGTINGGRKKRRSRMQGERGETRDQRGFIYSLAGPNVVYITKTTIIGSSGPLCPPITRADMWVACGVRLMIWTKKVLYFFATTVFSAHWHLYRSHHPLRQ